MIFCRINCLRYNDEGVGHVFIFPENRQILIVIYCRIQCYNESYVRLATNCKDIKPRNGPNQNILMILSCQLGGYAEICIAFLQICFHGGETNWTSLIYSPFSTAFELISSLCTISSLEFNFRTNSHLYLEEFHCLFASSSAKIILKLQGLQQRHQRRCQL